MMYPSASEEEDGGFGITEPGSPIVRRFDPVPSSSPFWNEFTASRQQATSAEPLRYRNALRTKQPKSETRLNPSSEYEYYHDDEESELPASTQSRSFQNQLVDLASQCSKASSNRSKQQESFAVYRPDLGAFTRTVIPTSSCTKRDRTDPSNRRHRTPSRRSVDESRSSPELSPHDSVPYSTNDASKSSPRKSRQRQQQQQQMPECETILYKVYQDLCPEKAEISAISVRTGPKRYYADGRRKSIPSSETSFLDRSMDRSTLEGEQASSSFQAKTCNNDSMERDFSFDGQLDPTRSRKFLSTIDRNSPNPVTPSTAVESPSGRSRTSLSSMRKENAILDQSNDSSDEHRYPTTPVKKVKKEESRGSKQTWAKDKLEPEQRSRQSEGDEKEEFMKRVTSWKVTPGTPPRFVSRNKRDKGEALTNEKRTRQSRASSTSSSERSQRTTKLIANLMEEISELKRKQKTYLPSSPIPRPSTPTPRSRPSPLTDTAAISRPSTPPPRTVEMQNNRVGGRSSPMVPRTELIHARQKLERLEQELQKTREQLKVSPTNAQLLRKVVTELKIARKTEENLASQLARTKHELNKMKERYSGSRLAERAIQEKIAQIENGENRHQGNQNSGALISGETDTAKLQQRVEVLLKELEEAARKADDVAAAHEAERAVWEKKQKTSERTTAEFQKSLRKLQEKLVKAESEIRSVEPCKTTREEVSLLKFKLQNAETQIKEERKSGLEIERNHKLTIQDLEKQLLSSDRSTKVAQMEKEMQSLRSQLKEAKKEIASLKRGGSVFDTDKSALSRSLLSPIRKLRLGASPPRQLKFPPTPQSLQGLKKRQGRDSEDDSDMSPPLSPPQIGGISSPPISEINADLAEKARLREDFFMNSREFMFSTEQLLKRINAVGGMSETTVRPAERHFGV